MNTAVTRLTESLDSYIGPEGVSPGLGVLVDEDGQMTILAMAISSRDFRRHVSDQISQMENPESACFAFDCFARDGQGTTLQDLLVIYQWSKSKWSFAGIVEYQDEPRLIKPLNTDNDHWNVVGAEYLTRNK